MFRIFVTSFIFAFNARKQGGVNISRSKRDIESFDLYEIWADDVFFFLQEKQLKTKSSVWN